MPRYFFHVDGASPYVDDDGIELVDDNEAWSAAIISIGELLKDMDGRLPNGAEIIGRVTQSDGRPLITLRFKGERHGSDERQQ